MPRKSVPGVCVYCGSQFLKRKEQMFCNKSCRMKYWMADKKKPEQQKQPIIKECVVCGKEFTAKNGNQIICSGDCKKLRIYENYEPRPLTRGECARCGNVFYRSGGSKFCSVECNKKTHKGNKNRKHIQRARRAGVVYESVDRIKVFNRDNWTCQLCGLDTPKYLIGTNYDNAPELDHWIPLALGGPHTYSNVKCLCRRCNGMKGANMPKTENKHIPTGVLRN